MTIFHWCVVFWSLFLGLLIGGNLNVLLYRMPRQLDLFAGSHCPNCGGGLRFRDLFPVFGWIWNCGKCRHCHAPIDIHYPAVELTCMVILGGLTAYSLYKCDSLPKVEFYFFQALWVTLFLTLLLWPLLSYIWTLKRSGITVKQSWKTFGHVLLRFLITAPMLFFPMQYVLFFLYSHGLIVPVTSEQWFRDELLRIVIVSALYFTLWILAAAWLFQAYNKREHVSIKDASPDPAPQM